MLDASNNFFTINSSKKVIQKKTERHTKCGTRLLVEKVLK